MFIRIKLPELTETIKMSKKINYGGSFGLK